MKITLPGFLLVLGATLNCATPMYEDGRRTQPIVLAAAGAQCQPAASYKQWFFLYGLVPIGAPDHRQHFRDTGMKYRIVEEYDGWDAFGTIALGFLTSVGRKTVRIEECGRVRMADFDPQLFQEELDEQQNKLAKKSKARPLKPPPAATRRDPPKFTAPPPRQAASCEKQSPATFIMLNGGCK